MSLSTKTQVNLKDKWRNWQRNVHNHWINTRGNELNADLKKRIKSLMDKHPPQSGPLKYGLPGPRD
jgi:hypothetical protein